MIEKHKRWLESCRAVANLMVEVMDGDQAITFHDVMDQLRHSYVIAMDRVHEGVQYKAAKRADMSRLSFRRAMVAEPTKLDASGMKLSRDWGTSMALASANYREAEWVFRRSLLDAAILMTKGNRLKASRILKVNRNTTWRIPRAPAAKRTRKLAA